MHGGVCAMTMLREALIGGEHACSEALDKVEQPRPTGGPKGKKRTYTMYTTTDDRRRNKVRTWIREIPLPGPVALSPVIDSGFLFL